MGRQGRARVLPPIPSESRAALYFYICVGRKEPTCSSLVLLGRKLILCLNEELLLLVDKSRILVFVVSISVNIALVGCIVTELT